MRIPSDLKHEIINAVFNYYRFNDWFELKSLVFDSDTYPVRDFSIVCDPQYNIIYWGYNLGEAYFDPNRPPKNPNYSKISYIQDYNDDTYIFFDEKGRDLTGDIDFYKTDNMDGEIISKSSDETWYVITLNGPILEN